jgi:hypothetical protein
LNEAETRGEVLKKTSTERKLSVEVNFRGNLSIPVLFDGQLENNFCA